MCPKRRFLAPILAGVLIALPLSAAKKKKDEAKGPAFGATKMVTLNVAAEDSHGQPVGDLAQSDFEILDKGKPQTVEYFRHNSAKSAREDIKLGPNEYSNLAGNAPPNMTLILFDTLNSTMNQQGYARGRILEALKKVEDGRDLYLYMLTVEGLYAVRGLHLNGKSDAGEDGSWTKNAQPMLDKAMSQVYRMRPEMYTDDRVMATYQALDALAGRMAAIPGRKNLVWVTRGIPIEIGPRRSGIGEGIDYTPIMRQLAAMLEDARVALYPVDLAPPGMEAGMSAGGAPGQTQAAADPGTGMQSEATLQQLAGLTGGKAYIDENVEGAIEKAMQDSRSSYVIGYYPPVGNWDGKYHKLLVKCSRPGVRLLTKQGYWAYPPQAMEGPQQAAALQAAMWSPYDASEIGLRVTAVAKPGAQPAMHFQVIIRTQDVLLLRAADRFHGELGVVFVEYRADGKRAASNPAPVTLDFDAQQRQQAIAEGIGAQGDQPIDPGVNRIRVIVVDEYSDAIGSVTIPVGTQGS